MALWLSGAGGGQLGSCYVPFFPVVGFFWAHGWHYTAPPTGWRWPPSDNKWYSTGSGQYGPSYLRVPCGILNSFSGPDPWKPCQHAQLNGMMHYTGPGGGSRFWHLNSYSLFPPSQKRVPNICRVENGELTSSSLSPAIGSCVSKDPLTNGFVQNRNNVLQRWWPDNPPNGQDVGGITELLADAAAPADLIPEADGGWKSGMWGAWNPRYNLCLEPRWLYTQSNVFRITWEPLSRTRLKRHLEMEMLWSGPGGYEDATWRSGCKYASQAVDDVSVVEFTHVKSYNPTHLTVRSKIIYQRSEHYKATGPRPLELQTVTNLRNNFISERPVFSLMPGTTATVNLDVSRANKYCFLARDAAALRHDESDAKISRNRAIQNIQDIGSNMIENASGVKNVGGLLSPLFEGLEAARTGNAVKAAQSLASAYLIYKYVYENSVRDATSAAKKGPQAWARATRHARSTERRRGSSQGSPATSLENTALERDYYCTLYMQLRDSPFARIFNALERLGLEPTPGQLWENIPLSFAVDWFLNIGGTLSVLSDYYASKLTYDLKVRIQTYRCEWQLSGETIDDLFGTVVVPSGKPPSFSWYSRHLHGSFGSIDPLAASKGSGLGRDQMIQGSALIIQRL